MNEDLNFGLGIDPEIVREFEGLWVRVMKAGKEKPILGLLKKVGERSALFVSPTKQSAFAALYDDIEGIESYTGPLNLPDGTREVRNGKVMETATNEVV